MRGLMFAVMLAVLGAPFAAEAQRVGEIPRIGMLVTFSLEHPQARELSNAFRQGLHELGYVEGQNIAFEYRSAQGNVERLEGLLAELMRLKVDLIFALGSRSRSHAYRGAVASRGIW
jgi:ABC-type uncharacterized transport system substrate-binding protein